MELELQHVADEIPVIYNGMPLYLSYFLVKYRLHGVTFADVSVTYLMYGTLAGTWNLAPASNPSSYLPTGGAIP